jgi:pyridoxamine 5'-phosphate oxidase
MPAHRASGYNEAPHPFALFLMTTVPSQCLPETLPDNPLATVDAWLTEAYALGAQPNPNAMTLATIGENGQPSARIVLLKELNQPEGSLLFVTNYQSRKAKELDANPRAAVVLHWDVLHRQVRIEGHAVHASSQESDEYFAKRPWQSQIGAWASAQSEPVANRTQLVQQLRAAGKRFNSPPIGPDAAANDPPMEHPVPRPPHWGAIRLWIDAVELWVEGNYRIHDRARWSRSLVQHKQTLAFSAGPWHATRLQP